MREETARLDPTPAPATPSLLYFYAHLVACASSSLSLSIIATTSLADNTVHNDTSCDNTARDNTARMYLQLSTEHTL
jgi:hypothetical protein